MDQNAVKTIMQFKKSSASAFTPEEWKSEKSLIADYAKNGIFVE